MEKLDTWLLMSSSPISRRSKVTGHPCPLGDVTRHFSKTRFSLSSRRYHGFASCSRFSAGTFGSLHDSHVVVNSNGVASSTDNLIASAGINPQSTLIPISLARSPLFWTAVGVGLSVLLSWVAKRLKKYAMQQVFKTLINQMNAQDNRRSFFDFTFGQSLAFPERPLSPTSASSPFPPAAKPDVSLPLLADPGVGPAKSSSMVVPESENMVDVCATRITDMSTTSNGDEAMMINVLEEHVETAADLDKDELFSTTFDKSEAASNPSLCAVVDSQSTRDEHDILEYFERIFDDPRVLKIISPFLPEELRDPITFKGLLQNTQYRQKLLELINNMNVNGSGKEVAWLMQSLRNLDINNSQMKQQLDKIGVDHEEIISKLMSNPDVALALQNPKVLRAVINYSQDPQSIFKLGNVDNEVMSVVQKLQELFPM